MVKYVLQVCDEKGNALHDYEICSTSWLPIPNVGDVASVAKQSDQIVVRRTFSFENYASTPRVAIRLYCRPT